jgi:hypothetical protein
MSLINDALKRTKDAQQQNPPPAGGPPLKPADPATTKSTSNAKSLLYIMIACVVVGNALLFFAIQDRGAKKEIAPAVPVAPTTAAAVAPAPTASVAPAPVPQPAKSEPAPAAIANPAPIATPVVSEKNSNDALLAAQPEPARPVPLKLQSIIFNPSKPSAMVSGKFVFIGDKVQGFRVTAIDQETVTLVGSGQTNILSLP